MEISKSRKIFISILAIFLIFSPIIVCNYSHNKTINKEIKISKNIKQLDQEGNTYRLVTSADNVQVPVPKGYVASNITGENYVTPEYSYTDEIKTKIHDGGFVIYELTDAELETDPNGTSININDTNKDIAQSTRNQYVWVPVENIEDIVRTKTQNNGIMQFGQGYSFSTTSIIKETNTGANYYREPRLAEQYDKAKYYLQKYMKINNRQNYINNMQEDFARMIESINKYKGFYIGRYETGDDYTHSSSKGCFTNPRVVRYNSNINYVRWYNSYDDAKKLAGNKEKYVKTGMIYDSLWDYTLKWLNETDTRSYEDIYSDSGTWGNYSNNTKTTSSGGTSPAKTGAIETITYKGETYSDSPTASNNIFDIVGNVYEWTVGRYSSAGSYRELRGGSYYGFSFNSHYVASARSNDYPNNVSVNFGFRSLLCIN